MWTSLKNHRYSTRWLNNLLFKTRFVSIDWKFFCTEHEFRVTSCPSRRVFMKKGVETPKNSTFGHFWKIADMKLDVIESLLVSLNKACHIYFKTNIEIKATSIKDVCTILLDCSLLKEGWGVTETETLPNVVCRRGKSIRWLGHIKNKDFGELERRIKH